MRKIKIYTGLISILGVSGVVLPLTSCSCSNEVTVTFVAGDHGKIHGGLTPKVVKGSFFKEVIPPGSSPDTGYELDGYYMGDEKIDPNYKVETNITVTVKFKLKA